MKNFSLICILMVSLFITIPCHAEYIVDTGQPSHPNWGYPADLPIIPGQDIYPYVQFTLDDPYYINSIQGYVTSDQRAGELYVAVYSADKKTPTPGQDLVPGELLFTGSGSYLWTEYWAYDELIRWGWVGPTGLNQYLEAGSYWLYFYSYDEVYMGSSTYPVPNRLVEVFSDHGYYQPSTAWWYQNLDFGVRIEGSAAVPEPSTLLLLGLGLIGITGVTRKSRR